MKKVVLLGDSIRLIGYGKRVEELLGDQCTVWQPEDNCRFAKYTLRMLFDEQQNIKNADVIHWNNGLWDACDIFGDGPFSPLEEYVENMLRIAQLLQSYGKKVIFATTFLLPFSITKTNLTISFTTVFAEQTFANI